MATEPSADLTAPPEEVDMEPRRTLWDRIVERVPMTIPQYVDLGGQSYGLAENWTRLRTADGLFALEDRAVWLAGSKQLEIRNRAEATAGVAQELGATRIASCGVGEVFRRLRVERILFTGEFVLTWARARYLIALAAKCAGDRGGHFRTPAALRRLWWNAHGAEAVGVGDLPGFTHTPRGGS